uniref:Uncharacterized protein n=1 Tax=viral metagenome TaxID=1070528 RepID=A0A6C0EB24_9ZZZZ
MTPSYINSDLYDKLNVTFYYKKNAPVDKCIVTDKLENKVLNSIRKNLSNLEQMLQTDLFIVYK